jgi:hypothetical protein
MKRYLPILLALTLAALLGGRSLACGCAPTMIHSDDPADRQLAIEAYREMGPRGLHGLLKHRDALLKAGEDPKSQKMAWLNEGIDAVGGAKYCTTSRLYWYTDLEEAKQAAAHENKPILSLRMLGKLTDDLSCANSRFFRTTLYANEEISNLLREKFVLHWQSVRPVPKITIDFGDGRKLERTITGNSAHYVLLADGTVVDSLPGLYGPKAFQDKLTALLKITEAMPSEPHMRRQMLVAFHQGEEAKIAQAMQADLEKIGLTSAAANRAGYAQYAVAARAGAPPAEAAAVIARPKNDVERPAIAAVRGRKLAVETAMTDEVWEKLAALHADDARLDQASRKLIASQNPTAAVAGVLAVTKARVESPLVRLFRSLEQSVAVDTVRNEYELHRKLHRWFVEGTAPANVDELNDRVYAELFLTPKTDPWLGLLTADAYSALPDNGVSVVSQK